MRENRSSGSEGGGNETNRFSLPLSVSGRPQLDSLRASPTRFDQLRASVVNSVDSVVSDKHTEVI
jgi:hypothetical protein